MAEIESILFRLASVFNTAKLRYVIVEGIAVIHYGHIRTTQDIDLIIEDDSSKISKFIGLLQTYDFDVMNAQIKTALQEGTHASIFDNKSYMRLDITIAHKKYEIDVLENAIKKKIFGCELFIAPLEYVLIGKLLFIGRIDDIPDSELLEYQDIFDFLTLYHSNIEDIDMVLLERKVKEIGLDSTINRLKSIQI